MDPLSPSDSLAVGLLPLHVLAFRLIPIIRRSSSSAEVLIQTLNNRGWCLREIDQIRTLIETKFQGSSTTLRSVESELCNMLN
ncbi:hypothetical protein L1887_27730 [Cichorium endivia]|nr:hypothetical protein L1887_27730 [Cichorium endivia]